MKGPWFVVALFVSAGVCVHARKSPNADAIAEYYMKGPEAGRYSDNLLEDSQLDVPGLIKKYGYPVEVHNVVTEDGYIVEMHRIPRGRKHRPGPRPAVLLQHGLLSSSADWVLMGPEDSFGELEVNSLAELVEMHRIPRGRKHRPGPRPAVLLQHGLLSSSADWVLMGPEDSFAYLLADAGYDVWLGNARGNYYSRNHTTLNPDKDTSFWKFSWEEIGMYDLTAMIDHILATTNKKRLHYIGHSQGTTAFWVMASMRPEYNDKIISMQAFAPVAYLTNNRSPVFRVIAPLANQIELLGERIGINELFSNNPLFTWAGRNICADGIPTQPLCTNMLFIIAGRSEDMFNATLFPVKLAHTPAGAAVRQIVHYGQHIRKGHFRRFDHGMINNWRIYRSFTPPSYPLYKITAPVIFHYVDDDVFAHLDDVDRLWRELGRPLAKIRVPHATFSHLDFMWGLHAKHLLYERTISLMNAMGDD